MRIRPKMVYLYDELSSASRHDVLAAEALATGKEAVSEENKELARRFLEAQAKGDMKTLDDLMVPDFVNRSLLPGQKPSREDYKQSVTDMLAVFSNTSFTVEAQIAEGDQMVSRFTGTSVHRGRFLGADPTGQETSYSGITIRRVADGKIVEEWSESDNLEVVQPALEQERRERIDRELRVAQRIQQAALPKEVSQLGGWQIDTSYRPAREVGGDFYQCPVLLLYSPNLVEGVFSELRTNGVLGSP